MTTLAFVVAALVIVSAGFWAFKVLDFPEEVDEGRVLSDGIRRTDAATRRTFREPGSEERQ